MAQLPAVAFGAAVPRCAAMSAMRRERPGAPHGDRAAPQMRCARMRRSALITRCVRARVVVAGALSTRRALARHPPLCIRLLPTSRGDCG